MFNMYAEAGSGFAASVDDVMGPALNPALDSGTTST